MGRPREHDLDSLLDCARDLWVAGGVAGLTIRALSAESKVSNGAIYHAFGTRAGLLAAVWGREATGFLAHMRERVRQAATGDEPIDVLLAAGLAPATYAADHPEAARLLLAADLGTLFVPELDEDQRAALSALRRDLGRVIADVAETVWQRRDRPAVTLARYCIVNLPGTLLLGSGDVTDPLATHALEHAIRGIGATGVPSLPAGGTSTRG